MNHIRAIFLGLCALLCLAGAAGADEPTWKVTESKVPGEVRNVLFGDFSGDGKDDFVTTYIMINPVSGKIDRWAALFLFKDTGYRASPDQAWLLDGEASVLDVADLIPGNKGPELAYVSQQGVRCYVFGERAFEVVPRTVLAEKSFFSFVDRAIAPTFSFTRDIDEDGVPEIILPNISGTGARIFVRDEAGDYRPLQELAVPLIGEWGHHSENEPILNRLSQMDLKGSIYFPKFFLQDFNADGRKDILYAINEQLFVFARQDTQKPGEKLAFASEPVTYRFPAFTPREFLKLFRMRRITRIWVTDFNNDGHGDVYLTVASVKQLGLGGAYSRAYIYMNRGGHFLPEPDQTIEVDGLGETVWAYDLTGDGHRDLLFQTFPFNLINLARILILGSVPVQYKIFAFDPATGKFDEDPVQEESISYSFEPQANSQMWAAYLFNQDFNGDGKLDLVQSTDQDELGIFLSDEDGWAQEEIEIEATASFFIYGRDINGDGRSDLALRYENIAAYNGTVTTILSEPAVR
ncbi:MAG: VCBS repeat-containing protein [Chrysiogenetes bacterium]|nr:VCBS repeat-containing protein [Chrysiogenetes bacterium]